MYRYAACTAVVVALAASGAGCGSGADRNVAACEPRSFLPVLQRALDSPAGRLHIAHVDVKQCRNDYARVFAVPDNADCVPGVRHCYGREQVFLQRGADTWRIIDAGTGIGCDDADLTPALVRACAALGS
jgi:hypothetical protein